MKVAFHPNTSFVHVATFNKTEIRIYSYRKYLSPNIVLTTVPMFNILTKY